MTYLLVGTTSYTYAGGAPPNFVHSIPVPTGTQVGDLLVVGFFGDDYTVPDTRLTVVNRSGPTTPAGGYGVATDLSDVQIESVAAGGASAIVLVALRDSGTLISAQARTDGTIFTTIFGADPSNTVAIAFVIDIDVGSAGLPSDASGYTTLDTASASYFRTKAYSFAGTGGIPAMNVAGHPDLANRSATWFIFDAVLPGATGSGTYLRQRQSPVRAPSRIRPPVVRQRQRPEVTT